MMVKRYDMEWTPVLGTDDEPWHEMVESCDGKYVLTIDFAACEDLLRMTSESLGNAIRERKAVEAERDLLLAIRDAVLLHHWSGPRAFGECQCDTCVPVDAYNAWKAQQIGEDS